MPSTYTQNLGIELPATGEQANLWGLTVNRNMDTLDTAINGNVRLDLSTSPYQLTINNGSASPVAANPVIIWGGAQTAQGAVHIDWQSSRKHFYCMSNQTSGGFEVAFAQGTGAQFVLQAGYDALLYSDGGGAGANVAAALGSPQFTNLLATGAAQVNGALTVKGSLQLGNATITVNPGGSVNLPSGLGVGNPASIPDMVTINGLGAYGQLRMVYGGYGAFFRNDGVNLYLMVTKANDPYGIWSGNFPFYVDLASKNIGMAGWPPSASYGLQVPTLHVSTMAADGDVSSGGRHIAAGGFLNTGGRSYFSSGDQYQIALQYSTSTFYIGTNPSNQFQLSNINGSALLLIDSAGNAALSAGLHVLSGGVQYPDGTIQTTAISNSFSGNITVNGVIYGPASSQQSPILYCFPYHGVYPSNPINTVVFTYNEAGNYITFWVTKSDGSRWIAPVYFQQPAPPGI